MGLGICRRRPERRQYDPEDIECQAVNEHAVEDVDDDVHQMVAQDIELVKVVVQGEGDIHGYPGVGEGVPGEQGRKVLDLRIPDDAREIVENKGRVQGVAVGDEGNESKEQNGEHVSHKLIILV